MAYTMLAERADRQDEQIRLAVMLTGKQPQGLTMRDELDDWLSAAPEEV